MKSILVVMPRYGIFIIVILSTLTACQTTVLMQETSKLSTVSSIESQNEIFISYNNSSKELILQKCRERFKKFICICAKSTIINGKWVCYVTPDNKASLVEDYCLICKSTFPKNYDIILFIDNPNELKINSYRVWYPKRYFSDNIYEFNN